MFRHASRVKPFLHVKPFLAVIPFLVAMGCRSISDSVNSISNSVNNALESVSHTFESSSDSSSGRTQRSSLNYQRDLQSFTLAWLARDEPDGELVRAVGRIAELHGITNWEASPATQLAMREAANDPGLDDAARERLRVELLPLGPAYALEPDPRR